MVHHGNHGNSAPSQASVDASNPDSPGYNPSSPDYNPNIDYNSPSYTPTQDPNSDLYVAPVDEADTGTELQDQANQQAQTQADQTYGDVPLIGDMLAALMARVNGQANYRKDLNAQANQLAAGLNTRTPPSIPNNNYMSVDHSSLKTMVNDDADPQMVGEMGQYWTTAGNQLVQFQSDMAKAINNSQADWQGQAADSARKFMADTANWVGTAGQSSQLAGTQMASYSDSLSTAKSTMPEPIPFDVNAANQELNGITDDTQYWKRRGELQAQYDASNAAHEQAAEVMTTYDNSLSGASTMPAFGKPPTMSGSGGTDDGTGDDGSSVRQLNGGVDGPSGNTTDTGGTNTGNGNNTGNNNNGIPDDPTGNGGTDDNGGNNTGNGNDNGTDDGTDPSQYPGPNNNGNGPGTGPGTGPGNGPGHGNGPGTGPGSGPFGGMPMGGGPGGGYGSDSVRSGSGFGRGGAGFGGSGAAGEGSGMGRGGAGAAAASESAYGGRGGAGGRGGGTGGMGAGGRRGQGEEDGEHQRPGYLVEPDPDDMFGSDQLTAPPVIGG